MKGWKTRRAVARQATTMGEIAHTVAHIHLLQDAIQIPTSVSLLGPRGSFRTLQHFRRNISHKS
jgi:hypothetical protein